MIAPVARPKKIRLPAPPRRAQASRWISDGQSAIHGRGLYARESIPVDTRVIEYTGERITKTEAARREAQRRIRLREGGDGCVYIFEMTQRYDLDGRASHNLARLINHSCAPNCRVEVIRGRVWIVARREIAAGAELSFDYGFAFAEWPLHPCRCGSLRCPGFIVNSGQRWRLRRIPRAERARRSAATLNRSTLLAL